jgi:NADPH:quinone reductase-like Zn-dependent oxidoreductase
MLPGAANVVQGPQKSWWSMIKSYMSLRNYSPLFMIQENKAACGYHMGYLTQDKELIQGAANALIQLYEQGKIKPCIDSVWDFNDVSRHSTSFFTML